MASNAAAEHVRDAHDAQMQASPCSFDSCSPAEICDAFEAQATAPNVTIGLTIMVYIHLITLSLQPQQVDCTP